MAVRAMQDAKEESGDEDEALPEPSEGDSLPLRHALENQNEEVYPICDGLPSGILLCINWPTEWHTAGLVGVRVGMRR